MGVLVYKEGSEYLEVRLMDLVVDLVEMERVSFEDLQRIIDGCIGKCIESGMIMGDIDGTLKMGF